MNKKRELDSVAIHKYLPHRYPFMLIDRVLDYSGEHVVALKNITANENYFTGHFPDLPVMPGVLQIETMAQASAFLAYDSLLDNQKKLEVYFLTIDNAKFRKVVVPGDQLMVEIKLVKRRKDFWWTSGTISVDGSVVCEANMSAVLKLVD